MSAQRKGPRLRKVGSANKSAIKIAKPARRPLKLNGPMKALYGFLSPVLNILAKLVPPYLKNSWAELRQVTWPNRGETWRLTSAVFIFAVVFGAAVLGVDKGLDEIFKKVILK